MSNGLLERVSSRCFDTLVLLPITVAHRRLGEDIWNPLDRVAGLLSRYAGLILGPIISGSGEHKLSSAMELIDRVEALVGVRGSWEILDDKTVLRKVPSCPFAERLSRSSSFCMRLGVTMGQQALSHAFPEKQIDFEILSTISNGDPCCSYRIRLRP